MRLAPLLLMAVPVLSPQTPATATDGARLELPVSETLYYNVEWRLITAGRVKVDWRREANSAWQVNLHVESTGFVSKLYKVDDLYGAHLNPSLCAESVQLTSHEGNRERETRISFDAANHRASYLERDRARNTNLLQHEIEIPPCVHDVLGGLYFLRTLNLEPGQSVNVPVTDGKRAAMARVEAQNKEDIKTAEGTFHTICYEAYLFNNVLYRRPAHLNVWLTDDRRRLPVQIRVRMQFTIGNITLQLTKHE